MILFKADPNNTTMFHHSDKVIDVKSQTLKENPNKTHGTYFRRPDLDNPLSVNNAENRHVFKTKNFRFLDNANFSLDVGAEGTMKTLSFADFSLGVKKFLRKHFRINIKNYLKRKYNKPTYLLPIESFQCLRFIKNTQQKSSNKKKYISQQTNENQNIFQTKNLYLFKPFYTFNLQEYLQDRPYSKNKLQMAEQSLSKLCLELIACAISHGGLDNFFLTTKNIYMDNNSLCLQINYTSIVGLCLTNCRSDITAQQSAQIFPYLTKYVLQNGTQLKSKISCGKLSENDEKQIDLNWKQIKFFRIRSVVINILALILHKDIYFGFSQKLSFDSLLSYKFVKDQFDKQYSHSMNMNFKKVIDDKFNRIAIAKFEKQLKKAKYLLPQQSILKLFQTVLVNEDRGITWQQLLDYFTNKQLMKIEQKLEESIDKIHEIIFERIQSDKQQEFYKSRGLDGVRLYLPVKYSQNFVDLSKYPRWWDIFTISDKSLREEISIQSQNFIYLVLGQILYMGTSEDKKKLYLTAKNICNYGTSAKNIDMDQQATALQSYFIQKFSNIIGDLQYKMQDVRTEKSFQMIQKYLHQASKS